MTQTQTVQVAEAKGRPMLHWVGKRPLDHVTAFPAQLVETFNPTGEELPAGGEGLLFHGDNKDVLAWLLAHGYRGKVNLIYIDPPFDSGADYVRRVQLRGVKGIPTLDGESHTLGEQIQYTDIWANDAYLQFMYERLLLLKELLTDDGSIFIHCDDSRGHHLRILADEVFGSERFINEIIWKRKGATSFARKQFGRIVDHILWYTKGEHYTFNPIYSLEDENTQRYIAERFIYDDGDGRGPYMKSPLVNPLYRPNLRYEYKGYPPLPMVGSILVREWKNLIGGVNSSFQKTKANAFHEKSMSRTIKGNSSKTYGMTFLSSILWRKSGWIFQPKNRKVLSKD